MKDRTNLCAPEKCLEPAAVGGFAQGETDRSDHDLARLAKALGHPARVRIVRILHQRKTCICGELVGQLPLAQSTVSQHLKILRQAGMIEATNDGPRVCYRLVSGSLVALKKLVSQL